jgi:hypothetical protein
VNSSGSLICLCRQEHGNLASTRHYTFGRQCPAGNQPHAARMRAYGKVIVMACFAMHLDTETLGPPRRMNAIYQ